MSVGVPPASAAGPAPLEIRSLSTRADLVSGGDVLLELVGPASARGLTVRAAGRDVTAEFRRAKSGRVLGLVSGLPLGRTSVVAETPVGRAVLDVVNHAIGGPVFSGPQVQPWLCETEAAGLGPAKDKACNAPTKVQYLYLSESGTGFQPYNPQSPPSDVATTTTDQGKTVPFIVRQEIGTMNRGIFHSAVLWDPKRPSTPHDAGAWNGKLYYKLEGGAGLAHKQGSAPSNVMQQAWLGKGFAIASNTLNTYGQNGNTITSAEAIMMLKERLIEQLGPIRYTMSSGGSGASIQQHTIANAYPGLLDGITTAVSFMDPLTTTQEIADCFLLNRYYDEVSPQLWPAVTQRGAVNGHESLSSCLAWDDVFQFDDTVFHPRVGCSGNLAVNEGPPAPYVYEPQTNPRGVRCTLQDYMSAVYGKRPPGAWGPVEKRIAAGFAGRPYDNQGVQYGLAAFKKGEITPEQFVDLNEKVGAIDIDKVWQPKRVAGDPFALSTAYRTGQVNDASSLDRIPMIDTRQHLNAEIHTEFRSWAMRARLDAANGHHRNQTIWTFNTGYPEGDMTAMALPVLDRWLSSIEADRSGRSVEQKVAAHRPAEAADACFVQQARIDDPEQCAQLNPYYADPRIAAGAPFRDDVLACTLTPPRRADYPATLTDAHFARVQAAFPDGVCDWTRRGRGQSQTVTWLSFSRPGGVPLGSPPVSRYTANRTTTPAPVDVPLPATGATGGLAWAAWALLAAAILVHRRRSRQEST